MKFSISISAVIFTLFATTGVSADRLQNLPDIPGFQTLHCDFHIHTVFSDGEVWPSIRVREAWNENLDCIAISEHLKYNKTGIRKKHPELQGDRNRSYEIAAETAGDSGLVVIRGAEVTQGMPPGHINAIFLTDANIAQPDYMDTMSVARDQGAFLFWNHPSWKSPDAKWEQDGIAQWFEEHDELFSSDRLHGIEVVNGRTYSREAHQWAIDKNLAVFGNTDIHKLIPHEYELTHEHRPQTLVFATEKTLEGVKEALFARRTAVWFGNSLIGSPELLEPLFQACIEKTGVFYLENLGIASVKNNCSMDFFIENTSGYSLFNETRFLEIKAGETQHMVIKTGKQLDRFKLSVSVKNLHTAPDAFLATELSFEATGEKVDKAFLETLGVN